MIKLEKISIKYKDETEILKNINLSINEGEIISIIGKNGAGKSTLLKTIGGILKPTKGKIFIDNIDAYSKKNIRIIREKIGMVFQNPDNQILFDNVYDDLEFAIKNLNLQNAKERIEKALKDVDMLQYKESNTYNLSLGQKQRINIAGAISTDAKYILLDEPTSMIDSKGKEKIYDIIKKLKKDGKTIIYVTNNINEILFADKIIIVGEHQIKKITNINELLKNPKILEDEEICIPDIIKLIFKLNENGYKIDIKNYSIEKILKNIINNR